MERPVKKYLLAAALAVLFLISPAKAQEPSGPQVPFTETLAKATLAVYQGKQICSWQPVDGGFFFGTFYEWGCEFKTRFTCTSTVIDQIGEHEYVGLTAGHCFNPKAENQYYVADDLAEKPVVHQIRLIKYEFSDRYDYAVFTFHSLRDYPSISLNGKDDSLPAIGTAVLNVNFGMGASKATLEAKVVSGSLVYKDMPGRYLVSLGVGPGASGSPVVDAVTHKIVGLVEAGFPGTQMSAVVIPTGSRLVDFMDDDSAGLRDKPAVGTPPRPPAPHVPSFWELVKELWDRILHKLHLG